MLSPAQTAHPQGAQSNLSAVRVGVAILWNESQRSVSSTWVRDQLVRDLNHSQSKDDVVEIEAVPLKAYTQKQALSEAANQHCKYVVLPRMFDAVPHPGVSVGPGVTLKPNEIAVLGTGGSSLEYVLLQPSNPKVHGGGVLALPRRDENNTFDESVSIIALRAAREVQRLAEKASVPQP